MTAPAFTAAPADRWIDCHQDVISNMVLTGRDFMALQAEGQVDYPRLLKGNVGAVICSMFPGPDLTEEEAWREVQAQVRHARMLCEQHPDHLALCVTGGQVDMALSQDKVALVLHLEGCRYIDPSLTRLEALYSQGVRSFSVTWNEDSRFGEGTGKGAKNKGLTQLGYRLVEKARSLGMLIDISHLSSAGADDVFEIGGGPVVATHANPRSICGVARNLPDRHIRGIGETQGFMGLVFAPGFLRPDTGWGTDISMSLLIEHYQYMVRMAGEHVPALGSDYDGTSVPDELTDVSCLPVLEEALEKTGISKAALQGFKQGNVLRVLKEVLGS